MLEFLLSFWNDESGAVTVDFVVLCAAAAMLGMVTVSTIAGQVNSSAGGLGGIVSAEVTAAATISGTVTPAVAITD